MLAVSAPGSGCVPYPDYDPVNATTIQNRSFTGIEVVKHERAQAYTVRRLQGHHGDAIVEYLVIYL